MKKYTNTFRENITFEEAKNMLIQSRGALVEMLDLAFEFGNMSQKDRDIMYFRLIDWNSLAKTGEKFGVTRERIRQIEGKCEEKMRCLTEIKVEEVTGNIKVDIALHNAEKVGLFS